MNFLQRIIKTKNILFNLAVFIATATFLDGVPFFISDVEAKNGRFVKTVDDSNIKILKLSLEEAINLALHDNRALLDADNDLKIRELTLEQEKSLFDFKLFPGGDAGITGSDSDNDTSLGIRGTVEKKFTNGIKGALVPSIDRSNDEYSASVGASLTIPLFRGYGQFVNLNSIDAIQHSLKTARRSIHTSRVNTIISTVAGVYDIIKQEKLLQILNQQKKRLKEHTEILKIKEKTDLISSLDIYRAEIRLKDVEDNYAQAWKIYAGAQDQLKIILAVPVEITISVKAPLKSEPVHIEPDKAVQIALTNRTDLQQADDNISESIRKGEIAKHNLLPEVNIAVDYNRFGSSEDFSRTYHFNENRWNIKLISTTDWSRKSEKIAFRQRLLDIKNARIALESKKDEIKRAVREQLEALKESENRIILKKKQIHQAQGKVALAEIKFRHGLADNSDFIEAETELQQSRANLLAAEFDYIVGTYRLRAALGTLLEH
ncbi:TolC family protein [Desulfococcaceae bacterium HSG7]|nr:TolC family protein [Desulfococcaceae bacterium HSG7]